MAVGIVDRQKLVNIADAVRAKKGITGNMTLDAIASNITSIPTADNNAKFDFAGSGSKSKGDLIGYLTTVDLSNFNTSNYTDMGNMFQNCTSITSLDVSNFNTSKVTNMGYMFSDCSSLTSLDVSSFNTSKVKDYPSFAYMFNNCNSLKALDLSTFDFSNTYAGSYVGLYGMFRDCKSLKTIKLPSTVTFNKSGISMGQMFYNCNSLTSLDLSGWDTSNVQYMGYMFKNCSSLTSLDLSGWDTSKVTDMESMFTDCWELTNLTLSNNWASNSSISLFDLSSCPLTHESAIDVINKLATRSNSPVIKFSSKVTLYQSEIDIATNKGWSVSGCSLIVEDPSTATVGQYAFIDGELSKCTYVADTPQAWGQRIFYANSTFTNSNGISTFEWGGFGTETGISNNTLGTSLSSTNALIAMNLQSSDGTPTVWDAITEFRSTHSDRWFIPNYSEVPSRDYYYNFSSWLNMEHSSNDAWYTVYPSSGQTIKTSKFPITPAIYV